MTIAKDPAMTGKEHYIRVYAQELDLEAEWLRRGAHEKVNSIQQLLSTLSTRPRTMIEMGCGTGAVITECQRRNLADEYAAVDYSPDAMDYVCRHTHGIDAFVADITDPHSLPQAYDVVILSHVLEHLEQPLGFLEALQKIDYRYLIAEVPLEDLLAARIKALFRDRRRNTAGHVQFFTAASFTRLLESAGMKVLTTRRYVPKFDQDTIEFICRKNALGAVKRAQLMALSRLILPVAESAWSRLYYGHYAALCQKVN